jgi:hypothetical protein
MGQVFVCSNGGLATIVVPGADRAVVGNDELRRLAKELSSFGYVITHDGAALRPGENVAEGHWQYFWKWSELFAIEACEPYPSVRVMWRTRGSSRDETIFAPERTATGRFFSVSRAARDRFASAVERWVEAILDEKPTDSRVVVERGWLDIEHVEWEEVVAMPDVTPEQDRGVYRSGSRAEAVIASRSAPTAFESLLAWLASSPDRRWRETPREISVTREHLYARLRDGKAYRLPISALRARQEADGDVVYTFGRGTFVILLHRKDCRVRELLDRRLEAGDHSVAPPNSSAPMS